MNDGYRQQAPAQYAPNNGIEMGYMDVQQPQLDPEQVQQLQIKKKADSLLSELALDVVLVLVISIFVMANKGKECSVPASMWLAVAVGVYLLDFIAIMYQFHLLRVDKRENIPLMGVRFLLLLFLVGWLIYGNVLYYGKGSDGGCNNGFKLAMFLVILVGYFEMMKCCCMSLFLCVVVPIVLVHYRRAARPNWIPAPPQFIQDLVAQRYNPERNQAQESCPICMVDFAESDEITPLPCDDKHYFHKTCIKEWLEKNNICPLCKQEITKEALKAQKKKLKEAKKQPLLGN